MRSIANHLGPDNPSNDPDIAASCANLAEKLIPRYLDIFTQPEVQESAPKLFVFLLRCMTTAEMHAKRSAAMFWVRSLSKPVSLVLIRRAGLLCSGSGPATADTGCSGQRYDAVRSPSRPSFDTEHSW